MVTTERLAWHIHILYGLCKRRLAGLYSNTPQLSFLRYYKNTLESIYEINLGVKKIKEKTGNIYTGSKW